MLPRPASGDLTGWEGSLRDLVPTLQELLSLNAGFVWLSETLDLTSHQPNLGAQIPLTVSCCQNASRPSLRL